MVSFLLSALVGAAPLEVAVLSKDVASSTLDVRWQPVTATTLAEPFARLEVHPDETFRAVALPGTKRLAVVRVTGLARDPSFVATLSLVSPGQPERVLATDVVRASKPTLLGSRLFVERGAPGPETSDGSYRVDAVTISEVDLQSGRLRTVFETKGYWTHLAGAIGRELIVYVAGPQGAKLEAVQVDTLAVRTLIPSMPAMAHDFVIDAEHQRVLFTIAEPGVERWFIDQVDVVSGKRTRLAEGEQVALLPTVLPSGLAWSPHEGRGLSWLGREGVALAAHGPGFERVRFIAEGLVFARHEVPGVAPQVFVTRLRDGATVPVVFPAGIVDVAGVSR
jgi:hypothetical protein